MKFYLYACCLLLVYPALLLSAEDDFEYEQPLNSIVAVVNDDVIMQSELKNELRTIMSNLQAQNVQLPPENVLQRQVLERIIMEKLQLQLAERNGIRIDDETLNANLRTIAQNNGLSLSEFRDVLERDGYPFETFREDIRDQIIIKRLRNEMVEGRTSVSDQEIDNLLATMRSAGSGGREYHLAHILIATPEAASPEVISQAESRASAVLQRLRQGADFTQMAIAESDGQQALNGGDLDWRSSDQIPTLFTETVESMRAGEISDLIRSPSGFHIIKVKDIRGGEMQMTTQTKARHILLKADEVTTEAEVKVRLSQLWQRISNGEDFPSLARSHSVDRVSAADGGDLGWVSPGDLDPQFEEIMNSLQAGEVSRPFETRFGWHIVQVLDRRQHDATDELQRARARQMIREQKTEEAMQVWLRRLRDESYVEYRIETESGDQS